METVFLYNESLFFRHRLKIIAKKIAGKNIGGPQAVFGNLGYGLRQLGQRLKINIRSGFSGSAIGVVSGIDALQWAIEQKKQGKVHKILAGQNIAMPKEAKGIIFHPEVDIFLVPSQWTKNFCMSFNQNAEPRIKVWAAGVKTLPLPESRKILANKCLIYKKDNQPQLLQRIKTYLKARNISSIELQYGNFSQSEYFQALKEVNWAIFMSASESQGLALHEAWMMNVPTLVWGGGHMKSGSYEWNNSSPAPYLTEDCGMLFSSGSDFPKILEKFLNQLTLFAPRRYHLENFTPEITAQKYLTILNSL
ncbi:MAG: hypothetical protein AAB729_00965 [Patescibacteria group bacterium]